MYEVTFNANGGTSVQKQVIEEDYFATEPETTRTGYTFTGWDYDFTQAITKNTKITASWSANKDTKYTVNYYLQNLDDSNYTLHESVELKGETDTTATAEIKEYTHFTFNQGYYKNALSGNINGDGGQVLSVYYTRDKYVISTARNNTKAGTVTAGGTYKFDKQITLTATTNAGYTFLGWYDGETCVCESEEFTFKAEKDVTYTATWSANTDTKYTINYYLQNLEDDNYTLHETVELKGATDTIAYGETDRYAHFTYNASKSTISGNINGDGNRVLSVYYTRNAYTLSINNPNAATITNGGTYKYGGEEFVTTVSLPSLGYVFLGWYNGETLLSVDLTHTFTVTQNVTAMFEIKAEMLNFYFTSTAITCSIRGIKDKTITEIVVPDYVTSISQGVFRGCSSLESITIPFVGKERKTSSDTYQYPFGYIFGTSSYTGGKGVTQYYYGSSTSSTTSSTYYIPTSLKKVTVTGGNILYGAFYNCSSLTSVVIGDSVTSIGSDAFRDCYKLVEVVNKSTHITVTKGDSSNGYVGYYALAVYNSGDTFTSKLSNDNGYLVYIDGAEKILVGYNGTETDLVLPSYITQIYQYAFSSCYNLTSVVIGDSVTSIGNSAFRGCSRLTSITIPFVGATKGGTSDTHFGYIFGASSYSYNVDYVPTSLKKVTVTGGNILYRAFYNCSSLTSIEIPDSVTSIGDYAFYSCSSLKSVVIGYSVTSIGNCAFENCSSLKSVVIGYSVTSIGDHAFSKCSSLTSIEIPDSVTSIGDYAFYSCSSLKSVVIGYSVTSIEGWAFYWCSSLTSVYYKGTASDWSKISIWSSNTDLIYATRYYYSVTKPTTTGNYWHYVDGVPTTKW